MDKLIEVHLPIEKTSTKGVKYTEYKKTYIPESKVEDLLKKQREQVLDRVVFN
jgi:hypothetical protein